LYRLLLGRHELYAIRTPGRDDCDSRDKVVPRCGKKSSRKNPELREDVTNQAKFLLWTSYSDSDKMRGVNAGSFWIGDLLRKSRRLGFGFWIAVRTRKAPYTFLRNEPILSSSVFRYIVFICNSLRCLQCCLQMGSFWKTNPFSDVFLWLGHQKLDGHRSPLQIWANRRDACSTSHWTNGRDARST
jgi:hypothetical protein